MDTKTTPLRKISREEIGAILDSHTLWAFADGHGGKQADLSDTGLTATDTSLFNSKLLHGAIFNGANLSGVTLEFAGLIEASLKRADLSKANLRNSHLMGSNLEGADLSGANLEGAVVWGTNFRNANLQGADLSYVNFKGPKYGVRNSKGEIFSDPDMRETDLRGAKLVAYLGQSRITDIDWSAAIVDRKDFLPGGVNEGLDLTQAPAEYIPPALHDLRRAQTVQRLNEQLAEGLAKRIERDRGAGNGGGTPPLPS